MIPLIVNVYNKCISHLLMQKIISSVKNMLFNVYLMCILCCRNNNDNDKVNVDVLRQTLFEGYIHHVNVSCQYAQRVFNLGLGSEPANFLALIYACGYQNGSRHSNNNTNNNNDDPH